MTFNTRKLQLPLFCLLLGHVAVGWGQVCATPGTPGSNTNISGTVNGYWTPNNGTYNGASGAIPISTRRGASTNIASGDLVLVMQMQCANLNITDTQSYGDGNGADTELGSPLARGFTDPAGSCLAGRYEYVRAGPASSATSLDLSQNPLSNVYVQAIGTATVPRRTFQVIRVPQYGDATLTGDLTAENWTGNSGGVIAIDVAGTLNLAGRVINADGVGFRGGGGRERSSNDANTRYRWDVDDRHATKGEGLAGTPRFVSEKRDFSTGNVAAVTDLGTGWDGYPDGALPNDGDFARGAPGNAGGGGTFWNGVSDNGGGGGGGNGGTGGRGGAGWRSAAYGGILATYSNLPEKKWGFGGALSNFSISRLSPGGGGGAGDNNGNSIDNRYSSGAAGGGVVLVRARTINGSGTILARGGRATDNADNDGAGGGGAGGSVALIASSATSGTISIDVRGGRGADSRLIGPDAHGPGGGGGGGVVYRTVTATVTRTGGSNGSTTTADSPPDGAPHGSRPGATGVDNVITVPADTPGTNTGFRCLDYGDAPSSYNLAHHSIGATGGQLFLGTVIPDGDPSALTSLPSTNATTDNTNGTNDEEGATLPTSLTGPGTYSVTVRFTNTIGSTANLCGWVDFDQDGVFQSDEGRCTTVTSAPGSRTTSLAFAVPASDQTNSGQFVARFRLTTGSLTTSTPTGGAINGEVEDFTVNATLPVSIQYFESERTPSGIDIHFVTASETRNIGFHIWGDDGSGMRPLTEKMIPARPGEATSPKQYQLHLADVDARIGRLAITAVDTEGKEDHYGESYAVDQQYGVPAHVNTIDWSMVKADVAESLSAAGYQHKNGQWLRPSGKTSPSLTQWLQVSPHRSGMQRVAYAELAAAGFDLDGVDPESIAVTASGHPVARHIDLGPDADVLFGHDFDAPDATVGSTVFNPQASILFWADAAPFPDALYISHYTHRIGIDSGQARPATVVDLANTASPVAYEKSIVFNEDKAYSFGTPYQDPWYAKALKDYTSDPGDRSYQVAFELDEASLPDSDATLTARVIGITNPPQSPNHEVELWLNGQRLLSRAFTGAVAVDLQATVRPGVLMVGQNLAEVRVTGGTAAPVDLTHVDELALHFQRQFRYDRSGAVRFVSRVGQGQFDIAAWPAGRAASFAKDEQGHLYALNTQWADGTLKSAALASENTDYWISTEQQLSTPTLIGAVNDARLTVSPRTDYLIIAHPAFMPASPADDHPLNDYIAARQSEGWSIQTIGIDAIQAKYGHGDPLPSAVTQFLKAAARVSDYHHVLLVGSDSYDYQDKLGLGSMSFIPTPYRSTLFVPFTPVDSALVDFDDDRLADRAVGRWPVRTFADLSHVVAKTLSWAGQGDALGAVVVVDKQDSNSPSFRLQGDELMQSLRDDGWANDGLSLIDADQVVAGPGQSVAQAVREQLFDAWTGRATLSFFVGHGSPTLWSRAGILGTSDLDGLFNQGRADLISSLTCYTSYFVSPSTNTLAHGLMNGTSGLGNGAVAVHGAATLSDYSGNGLFARTVLNAQLQGQTLGQAIQQARALGFSIGLQDQVANWTLLGDPTLRLNR